MSRREDKQANKEFLAKIMAGELIRHFEGLSLIPYVCPGGYLTVGWGHRIYKAEEARQITEADAWFYLKTDIENALASIRACLPKEVYEQLNENQLAALISFVFNIGGTAFSVSTMKKKLVMGKLPEEVAAEFDLWVYSGGQKLPGLVERRKAEKELFLSGLKRHAL